MTCGIYKNTILLWNLKLHVWVKERWMLWLRRVVLAALLTAFLVVAQASNEYQCVHVAPGVDCTVQPGWALWCAYGACFAWLALAVVAMIGTRQCHLDYPAVASEAHVGRPLLRGLRRALSLARYPAQLCWRWLSVLMSREENKNMAASACR